LFQFQFQTLILKNVNHVENVKRRGGKRGRRMMMNLVEEVVLDLDLEEEVVEVLISEEEEVVEVVVAVISSSRTKI